MCRGPLLLLIIASNATALTTAAYSFITGVLRRIFTFLIATIKPVSMPTRLPCVILLQEYFVENQSRPSSCVFRLSVLMPFHHDRIVGSRRHGVNHEPHSSLRPHGRHQSAQQQQSHETYITCRQSLCHRAHSCHIASVHTRVRDDLTTNSTRVPPFLRLLQHVQTQIYPRSPNHSTSVFACPWEV